MNKITAFLFLLFVPCFFVKLAAQDLHFSQFNYSPLNLGPSEAGNFTGDLRIAGLHRRQWASVTIPYQTFSISADAKLSALTEKSNGFGVGLIINQDNAGDGALQTLHANLSISYSFAITKDSTNFLSVGANGGFVQKNLDITKLNFDNQFDGDNFIPQSSTGETFSRTNYSFADLGFGATWTALYEKAIWNAGVQFQHLNRPNLSYYNTEKIALPILSQIHAGTSLLINDKLTLLPGINFMKQNKFQELNVGIEGKMILRNESAKRYAVGLGLFYRTSDALIPMISIYYNKFRFGLSYDINTSSLKKASNNKGGPEITLIYIAKKIKSGAHRRIVCPVY